MVQAVYQMVVQMNGLWKGSDEISITSTHESLLFFKKLARPSFVKVPFSRAMDQMPKRPFVTTRTQKPWRVLFPLKNSNLFTCQPIHHQEIFPFITILMHSPPNPTSSWTLWFCIHNSRATNILSRMVTAQTCVWHHHNNAVCWIRHSLTSLQACKLMNVNYMTCWTRLQTFLGLGNEKLKILMDVEKVIWRLLFSLAEGTIDPSTALTALNASIPWDSVRTCSLTDRAWFDVMSPLNVNGIQQNWESSPSK